MNLVGVEVMRMILIKVNFSSFTYSLQLTVVTQLLHRMDLWRATLAQQMVQMCSIVVIQVWFQRKRCVHLEWVDSKSCWSELHFR